MSRVRKNQTVQFRHISELTGSEIILTGVVLGFGDAVRKMWPEEMGEAQDEMLLIWRRDNFGNESHYAISPEDLVLENEEGEDAEES